MPVSVPYRGILFFNRDTAHIECGKKRCFRPLSGNLIFQSWKCTCQKRPGLFPSPIGESYFSIVREYEKRNDRIVSVPYRGILFFNKNRCHKKNKVITVSVPYRGILFFNASINSRLSSVRPCFRPLSGNLIFQ